MKAQIVPGLLALAFAAPLPALADVRFCNDTDAVVSVAMGYKGARDWTSEGWWNIDAGECKSITVGNGPKTHYYYRVESQEIDFDHPDYMFCTSDEEFTIVGDTDCEARGYDRERTATARRLRLIRTTAPRATARPPIPSRNRRRPAARPSCATCSRPRPRSTLPPVEPMATPSPSPGSSAIATCWTRA